MKTGRGRVGRISVLFALMSVALVTTLIIAAFEFGQILDLQTKNATLSAEVSSYAAASESAIVQANRTTPTESWLIHLAKLQSLDPAGALRDYAPDATMIVSGVSNGAGAGGTYAGVNEIRNPLEYFFSQKPSPGLSLGSFYSKSFNFTINSLRSSGNKSSSGSVLINASLGFVGFSNSYGTFNGTILARYAYTSSNGSWLISQEDWNFATLHVQYPVRA